MLYNVVLDSAVEKSESAICMYISPLLELLRLNCGAGEDSSESLGQQGDQTSQS